MNRGTHTSLWTILGAIGAGLVASLCCILPLVAALLGVGGFAASAFFVAWRPYFLGLTFVLLGLAFYLAYRPPGSECEAGSLCDRPPFVRTSRLALWVVAGLVIVLAAFPYYSGALVRAFDRKQTAPLPTSIQLAHTALIIQGMDCTACATLIEKNLAQIPGVRHATVSFETKVARVDYNPRAVAPERIVKAIEEAGYKVSSTSRQGKE